MKRKQAANKQASEQAGEHARDEVEESGKRLGALVADVTELRDKLLAQPLVNDRDRECARLVRQQVAIVRRLQVQLEVCRKPAKAKTKT